MKTAALIALGVGVGAAVWFVTRSSSAPSVPTGPKVGDKLTPIYWIPNIPGIPPALVKGLSDLEKSTIGHLEYGAPDPALGKDGKLCPCGVDGAGNCTPCGSNFGYKVYGGISSGASAVSSGLGTAYTNTFGRIF